VGFNPIGSKSLFSSNDMKIVVSDPVFLPEEYRKRLEVLGNLAVYESMPASTEELIARI
jgi:hypothetical protein